MFLIPYSNNSITEDRHFTGTTTKPRLRRRLWYQLAKQIGILVTAVERKSPGTNQCAVGASQDTFDVLRVVEGFKIAIPAIQTGKRQYAKQKS
jgi:hypothetical protein